MAFFPCIYFCENNQLFFSGKHKNLWGMTRRERADAILERSRSRQHIYELCLKFFTLCDERGLRLIVENPHATSHYLANNFPYAPALIDRNRTLRGDYFNKPTQYWFVNCEPTQCASLQTAAKHKRITSGHPGARAGICSEDRSMISPDYARNFISDFILGEPAPGIPQQQPLFSLQ